MFDSNRPNGSYIDVYVKLQSSIDGATAFDELSWTKIELEGDIEFPASNGLNEWNPVKFVYTPDEEFTAFAVKIEFRSENSSKIPRIQNFKSIAVT